MSSNFSAVVSAWRALGGTGGAIEIGPGSGMPEGSALGGPAEAGGMPPIPEGGDGDAGFGGEPPFGGRRGGHHASRFGEGINLERALGQVESDLLWVGVPALVGVAIELTWWFSRKRRPGEMSDARAAQGAE
jgi:hypothetical protein